MSLRVKTLLLLGVTLAVLVIVLGISARRVITDGFAEVERMEVERAIQFAVELVNTERIQLKTDLQDWSARDETYAFIADHNAEFVQTNLQPSVLTDLDWSFVALLDESGKTVHALSRIASADFGFNLPVDFQQMLDQGQLTEWVGSQSHGISGYLWLDGSAYIVACQPVLPTSQQGPRRGVIIAGRELQGPLIKHIAQVTSLTIDTAGVNQAPLPADFAQILPELTSANQLLIKNLHADAVAGYVMFKDIFGRPCVILRLLQDRPIMQRAATTTDLFLLLLGVAGLAFTLVSLILVEYFVLSRIECISRGARRIGESGKLSERLAIEGHDEIKRLASTINAMLADLEAANEKLRVSEDRYRNFIERSTEGIWRFEFDPPVPTRLPLEEQIRHGMAHGFLAECNDVYARMYGFTSSSELTGTPLSALLPADDPANVEYFRQLVANNYRIANAESHELDRQGVLHVYMNNVVGIVDDGHVARAWGTQRDVTQAKLAEQALRDSEERYRTLVESMSEGITTGAEDGTYTFANRAALELFGVAKDQLVGRNVREFISPEDLQIIEEQIVRRHAGELDRYEVRIRRPDGTTRTVQVTGKPLYDAHRAICGSFALMRDVTEQRTAQQLLEQRTAELQAIVNAFPDLYFLLDRDCTFIDFKANRDQDLAASPESFLGHQVEEILPPHVSRLVRWGTAEALKTGTVASFDYDLPINGQPRHFEARLCPVSADNVLAVVRDMTALWQAEALRGVLLSISEATSTAISLEELLALIRTELTKLIDTTNFYVALYEDSSSMYVFPYFVDELDSDYHPQRLEGSLTDYVRRTGQPLLADRYVQERLLEQGLVTEIRGAASPSWLGAPLIVDGVVIGVVAVQSYTSESLYSLRDLELLSFVSEHIAMAIRRKRSEETQRRLVAAVQHTGDTVMITDVTGTIVYVNPAFETVTGFSAEDAIGSRPSILKSGKQDASFYRQLWQTIGAGNIWRGHFTNRRADGTLYEEEAAISPIRDSTGEITSYVAVKRDVTESMALQAKLQQAAKMESLGVLAGGIAHDFNNLLTGMLGNASLAMMELPASSSAREYIEAIERTAQRAADLARQMLAYSGRGHFALREMDLSALVQDMVGLVEVSIPKKTLLRLHLADQLPAVKGDPTQIRQVVLNLLTNAADAVGDASGVITVRTGTMLCDRAYLSTMYFDEMLPDGEYAYIEVADSGCGMTASTLSRIFDPFFTTKPTGHGLGLAAVLGIVRGHRGAIKVYSEPGRGTTFKVLLPVTQDAATQEPAAAQPVEEWKTSGTILVVDDESSVLLVAKHILGRVGFEVLTASDGLEGVQVFSEKMDEIRVVLLDMTMPKMNGEEAFAEMRRLKPDACIVLTSGFSEVESARTLFGKGLAGFIPKPYRSQELLAKLREIIEPQ